MAFSKIILNGVTQIDLTQDTVAASNLISPNTAHDAAGLPVIGTASGGSAPTLQNKSVSYTPTESSLSATVEADSGYDGLSSVAVSVGAISSTYVGSDVSRKAAATITPTTTNQTIASGTYLTGIQTIAGDANLIAANIAQGISIFGVTGTHSGGGGPVLLNTTSIGSVSTTSTQASSLNINCTVSGVNNYDLLIVETSVNTLTASRHAATIRLIFLTGSSTISTKNGSAIATATLNIRVGSNTSTFTSNSSTTAYGVYPNSCSISNGTATLAMYRRYNSTSTGTINGTYTARVYGVNLKDLIGG